MNYCTEAIADVERLAEIADRNGLGLDHVGFGLIAGLLREAQKFVIPPPERVRGKVTSAACQWIRPPYPVMAIEYSITEPTTEGSYPGLECKASGKRIALVISIRAKSQLAGFMRDFLTKVGATIVGNEFGVVSIFYVDEHRMWVVAPGMAMIEPDRLLEDPNTIIDWRSSNFQLSVAPILPDTWDEIQEKNVAALGEEAGRQRSQDMAFNDVAEEAAMATRTILLLNTRNVSVVKVNEPSAKLNRKRERNGKPPFFAYHTINIFLGKPLRVARAMSESEIRAKFATTLPQTMVIGHYKVRRTGVFWWEHHVRGHREDGVVEKGYVVKEDR
jgi:hypothetical protein